MIGRTAVLAALALALPAVAQDRVPAPRYFVETAMETSTAQVLAVNCPTLSIDPVAMARRSEVALKRLTDDGFTPENLMERMEDPSAEIAVLQDAFVAKHGLSDGADQNTVCAAGKAEIAEGSAIGALLLEVEG